MNIIELIKDGLATNGNKLSAKLIDRLYLSSKITHVQPTPNTRVCVITLPTGHEVVGYAQVLDAANDVEEIGQRIAEENAKEEIWGLCGAIAKCFIGASHE